MSGPAALADLRHQPVDRLHHPGPVAVAHQRGVVGQRDVVGPPGRRRRGLAVAGAGTSARCRRAGRRTRSGRRGSGHRRPRCRSCRRSGHRPAPGRRTPRGTAGCRDRPSGAGCAGRTSRSRGSTARRRAAAARGRRRPCGRPRWWHRRGRARRPAPTVPASGGCAPAPGRPRRGRCSCSPSRCSRHRGSPASPTSPAPRRLAAVAVDGRSPRSRS